MNYKEALFFIGKCLTINHESHNKILVKNELKTKSVDWDTVVKVSTSHYVFPALYCNLKKANFLHYLPDELVAYMQHITALNRERNEQIITQAKELNELLLAHHITPIFLKGTGNLLEGLYDDIAERMVGDIDFLVAYEDYKKTIDLVYENGYEQAVLADYSFPNFKHYEKLKKEVHIASIEIHKEMTTEAYAKFFNYDMVVQSSIKKSCINLLSFEDQLKLSIIAFQINDSGQYFKTINLRNAYDVFLISEKVNTLESINSLDTKLRTPLNNFLGIVKKVLNSLTIDYIKNKESTKYLETFLLFLKDDNEKKRIHKKAKRILFLKSRAKLIAKAFYKKEFSIWLLNRLVKGRVKS